MSVVNKAVKLKSETDSNRTDSFAKGDQIWAVFDRDEHPQFEEAINRAESSGIHVGYSNPCFELWLVLHYRDWDGPVSRGKIQKELHRLMPKYDPKRSKDIDFEAIKEAIEQAEGRGKRLEHNRTAENAPRGNPSTSLFNLTHEIRSHKHSK